MDFSPHPCYINKQGVIQREGEFSNEKIGFKVAAAIMVLALISIISLGFLSNRMTTITASSQNVMNN